MPVIARLPPPAPDLIERIRHFNRFYTRRIGVLQRRLLRSAYSLTEARVLWELAHADGITASALCAALDLDAGHLSRILRRFKERGLLRAERSRDDARVVHLALTAAGRRAFAPLDAASRAEVARLLERLPGQAAQELVGAMARIEGLLDDRPGAPLAPCVLRSPGPGDLGWVVGRHGALYALEYGWDVSFEALVARIVADYASRRIPGREACWIAERDGVNLGCVFLVQARAEDGELEAGVAQLRLLLVEPAARGDGLGGRLVEECSRFARQAGYRCIRLWTNSVLGAARRIYARAGYRLVASEPHHSFGHDLVGETWELELR